MADVIIKCPTCGIPLVPDAENESNVTCQICHFTIEVESLGPKKLETLSNETMRAALEKADQILRSPLKRSIKLTLTIGGEWGKRFAALQAINEGFKLMSGSKLVQETIKAGVNHMMNWLSGLQAFREASQKIVEHGMMSSDTVDLMLRDMAKFGKGKLDDSWSIEEDDSKNAEEA